MAKTVKGKLHAAQDRDFSGFRIVATFLEKTVLTETEGQFLPATRETTVTAAGTFSFEIPVADGRQGPVHIVANGIGGFAAGQINVPADGPLDNIVIEVVVNPVTSVTPSGDLTLGARIKYIGRAIDKKGRSIPANHTVIVWAKRTDTQATVPVSVSKTSDGGYFSDVWPQDAYGEAFAVVSGGVPIPLLLENSRLPLRLVIVVDSVPATKPKDDDCQCGEAPPRSPDAIDVAQNAPAFAKDSNRCVDFSIPNRTVEEVTYHAVVRTTQPEIKGRKWVSPLPVPAQLINSLAELACLRPEDLQVLPPATTDAVTDVTKLITKNTILRSTATSPLVDVISRGKDSGKFLENVVTRAQVFAPGIDFDGDWVNTTPTADKMAEAILSERIKNKVPLQLENSVLTELVREQTDLTPRRLLQAEHTSVVRQFRKNVQLLGSRSTGRFVLSADQQIPWDEIPEFCQASTIAHGHLLTLKQVWRADGYSLGDLLFSLPLAPGQQKRISVLDWSLEQVASRRAQRLTTEDLTANLSHDRDVDDIIRASLSEHMQAESHADTESVGGGIAGFVGAFVFGAAGGVSSAGSTASQTSGRDVAGIALNKIRDRTAQSASAVRSQRATVVQETKQGETVRAQTEVVGNYNHCHALTIEYFEVLRHFQVTQEMAHVQECLFIPFAISPFNLQKAARWRDPLLRYLRINSFREAFDAVDRVLSNWQDQDYPLARYADDAVMYLDGEFQIRMQLPRPKDGENGDFLPTNWDAYNTNGLLWDTADHIWHRYLGVALAKDRDAIWDERIAPGIAQRILEMMNFRFLGNGPGGIGLALDTTLVSRFTQDRSLLASLRASITGNHWQRAQISGIRFSLPIVTFPVGAAILVESATMSYLTDHFSHNLFTNRRILNDLSLGDDVEIATPLDIAEKRNPRERDRRLATQLVDHLNEHVEYYHRAIWFAMDPNRRYLLLDGFIAPDGGGRSVASVVENRVIGIVGNSLIMPVVPGQQLDPTYKFARATLEDLRNLYAGNPAPPIRLSIPTSGVFAEAVMGKCNSCEVIDDTKFWRWEDAPIPDQPPQIAPLSTDSRRSAAPSLAPDNLPESIARLQQTPDAPDPTGLVAAVKALGVNNIFKDLTGVALNQENAAQALKTSLKTSQEFASKAGALAQQKFLNKELDRSISQIKDARDKGLITDDQAKSLTESVLRGAIGEKRPNAQPPSQSPEIQRAMKRVANAKRGSMRVTRPDGTVEVNTDNSGEGPRINVKVDPDVPLIRQSSNMVCWAAGAAMMKSWQSKTTLTIEAVLDALGGEWRNKFDRNEGLTATELRALVAALNLMEEGPASYTPDGLARLLENKGPLMEIGDDSIEDNFIVHVRIITAMKGDGTTENTLITLKDPNDGEISEAFTNFDERHSSSDPVRFSVGLFHF